MSSDFFHFLKELEKGFSNAAYVSTLFYRQLYFENITDGNPIIQNSTGIDSISWKDFQFDDALRRRNDVPGGVEL